MENAVLERKYSGARAEGKEVLVLDSVWCKEKQRKYSADIVAREVYAVDGEAGFRGGKKTKIVCSSIGNGKPR